MYELTREERTAVKRGEYETNCRDVEVDRHCFERELDAAGDLRPPLEKVLTG